MPPFPRTYGVVRGGSAETVTVGDVEALLELRTELELVVKFGAGATPAIVAALDARLAQLASQEPGRAKATRDDVADMRSIVMDAKAPANALAVASIDVDFPEIKGMLNMSAIENESEQFHQEVAEAVDNAPATSEATPEADLPQAGGSEPAAEAGDTVVGDEEVETVTDALEELAAEAETELDAIASGFEEAANELTELGDTLQETVGTAESPEDTAENPDDERKAVAEDVAIDESDVAGPASTDADDVGALLESVEADVPAADTADSETADDAFEALAEASEAAAAGTSVLAGDAAVEPDQETFDPFAAADAATADEPAQTIGIVDSAATISEPVAPTFSGTARASQACGSFRGQIEEIKQNLVFQIDRLAEVLDGATDVQEQVSKTARQAAQFKQAADQAQAASQQCAAAQAEADQAKSTYEQAEARVAEARRAWETAQRTAADAAQCVEASA